MTTAAAGTAGTADYLEVNRQGWDDLSAAGCDSCLPYGPEAFAHARQLLDPDGWLPWDEIRTVCCLASGGGQQAQLFACLGYDVVVVDLSARQLLADAEVARRYGWSVECLEADMVDLTALHGRNFDLVYHPVSLVYVPDVRRVYRQITSVLSESGWYWSEQWNPAHMMWTLGVRSNWPRDWDGCRHYLHAFSDLLGGLGDEGLAMLRAAGRTNSLCAPADVDAAATPAVSPAVPVFLRLLCRAARADGTTP